MERAEGTDAELKVALLLVRRLNPDENLTNEEEAVLRGLDANTIGRRKARGEL